MCIVFLMRAVLFILMMTGCSQDLSPADPLEGTGGGADSVTIDMPFFGGYKSVCVQGAGGSYSHHYNSTAYDLDLDTPNDRDDPVFAPVNGTAYVHNAGATTGFGLHLTIDMHDGSYVILGHLKEVFVDSGSEVAAGELLGYEGKTGNTTGDHVHLGRHQGDAKKDGSYGKSIPGLKVTMVDDSAGGVEKDVAVTDAVCDLSFGHTYRSSLQAPMWHPAGSLLKTPDKSTVYLVEGDTLGKFMNEDALLTRGYAFKDVTLVSPYEMACYDNVHDIKDYGSVTALKDSKSVNWLLMGAATSADRYRLQLNETGAVNILKGYGITLKSFEDIPLGNDSLIQSYPDHGIASYRDGTLISPSNASDVYVIMDSVAFPVDSWDTLLLLGWGNREIIEANAAEIQLNVKMKGSCTADSLCISREDVAACNGGDAGGYHADHEEDWTDVSGGDEPAETGDPAVDVQALALTWKVPGGKRASFISLSGEFTDEHGVSAGWRAGLSTASNATVLVYDRTDLQSGSSLRFSVEYTVDGVTSWSCLGPYPPGTVQGSLAVEYGGVPLAVSAVKDPGSDGCGLFFTIP
jgi:hypothetical protein